MPQSVEQVRVRAGSEPERVETAAPWALRSLEYARLAAIVYRNADSSAILPSEGWSRSVDPLDTVDQPRTGLYFEVWEKNLGTLTEIAVVFRGTDDRKDWWSNARWLTRFLPTGWDQYAVVRALVDSLVDRARSRNSAGIRVVTAGHSLGGGLAQQAAYAHPGIKSVFAIDPSPVTGYRSIPSPARETNQVGIEILRVYEKGEILAYIRGFLRKWLPLSQKDPAIPEVRFNLLQGTAVTQHSMVAFAADLANVAGASTVSAAGA